MENHIRLEKVKSKTDISLVCTSFDLQKFLNILMEIVGFYFILGNILYITKRFYESGTRNGYCFVWGEQDGLRGSKQICTTLIKYLTVVEEGSTVIFWIII